jgi:hypothetical protein
MISMGKSFQSFKHLKLRKHYNKWIKYVRKYGLELPNIGQFKLFILICKCKKYMEGPAAGSILYWFYKSFERLNEMLFKKQN